MELPTLPPTRTDRIKLAAAILFGRSEDGGPARGWINRLARALGVDHGTISHTLKKEVGVVFDRKLVPFLRDEAIRLRTEADTLELIAADFEAGDVSGTLRNLKL